MGVSRHRADRTTGVAPRGHTARSPRRSRRTFDGPGRNPLHSCCHSPDANSSSWGEDYPPAGIEVNRNHSDRADSGASLIHGPTTQPSTP